MHVKMNVMLKSILMFSAVSLHWNFCWLCCSKCKPRYRCSRQWTLSVIKCQTSTMSNHVGLNTSMRN